MRLRIIGLSHRRMSEMVNPTVTIRAPQPSLGYQQTSEGLDALYDPSIGSETVETQGVNG